MYITLPSESYLNRRHYFQRYLRIGVQPILVWETGKCFKEIMSINILPLKQEKRYESANLLRLLKMSTVEK